MSTQEAHKQLHDLIERLNMEKGLDNELYSIKPLEWRLEPSIYGEIGCVCATIPNGWFEVVPDFDKWEWTIATDGMGEVQESGIANTFEEAKKLAEERWIDEIKKYLIRRG